MAPRSLVASEHPAFWHPDAVRGPSTPSFDDLVGGEQKLWRNGQPERFGGSKINHQIVFGWLLIGQIGGLLAAQDAIDIGGRATIKVGPIRAVTNQPSVYHVHTVGIDGW